MIWIDLPEIGVVDGARIAGLRRGRQSSPSRGRVGVAESRAAADPFYFLPFFFPVSVDFFLSSDCSSFAGVDHWGPNDGGPVAQ